jgi:hypothetical protein
MDGEWVKLEGSMIISEDNIKTPEDTFWMLRQATDYDNGWHIEH